MSQLSKLVREFQAKYAQTAGTTYPAAPQGTANPGEVKDEELSGVKSLQASINHLSKTLHEVELSLQKFYDAPWRNQASTLAAAVGNFYTQSGGQDVGHLEVDGNLGPKTFSAYVAFNKIARDVQQAASQITEPLVVAEIAKKLSAAAKKMMDATQHSKEELAQSPQALGDLLDDLAYQDFQPIQKDLETEAVMRVRSSLQNVAREFHVKYAQQAPEEVKSSEVTYLQTSINNLSKWLHAVELELQKMSNTSWKDQAAILAAAVVGQAVTQVEVNGVLDDKTLAAYVALNNIGKNLQQIASQITQPSIAAEYAKKFVAAGKEMVTTTTHSKEELAQSPKEFGSDLTDLVFRHFEPIQRALETDAITRKRSNVQNVAWEFHIKYGQEKPNASPFELSPIEPRVGWQAKSPNLYDSENSGSPTVAPKTYKYPGSDLELDKPLDEYFGSSYIKRHEHDSDETFTESDEVKSLQKSINSLGTNLNTLAVELLGMNQKFNQSNMSPEAGKLALALQDYEKYSRVTEDGKLGTETKSAMKALSTLGAELSSLAPKATGLPVLAELSPILKNLGDRLQEIAKASDVDLHYHGQAVGDTLTDLIRQYILRAKDLFKTV